MWVYEQLTGRISRDGELLGVGYSGLELYKNCPEAQKLQGLGPIPQGWYTIETPHDTAQHGPFVLPLDPDPTNEMFGRGGFLIHGDSVVHPGTASRGCIILAPDVRHAIWASGDRRLQVISGIPQPPAPPANVCTEVQ